MSLLTRRLPRHVDIRGTRWPIDPDFRLMVELENAADVQKAEEIFQARIDAQVQGGAFYPETIEGWKKAQVITKGSVVALISAGDSQSSAVEAFEKLFA